MIIPRGFEFKFDKISKTISNANLSAWQPSGDERAASAMAIRDYGIGEDIATRPLREFNDRTVREEIDVNQMAFNTYIPPRSDNPDDAWRAQTVRPITRNKLISIAAHVTAAMVRPTTFAQNSEDSEDRNAAETMDDLVEWVMDNSQYERVFMRFVMQTLVEPASFLHVGYRKTYRTIRKDLPDGTQTTEQVEDLVTSGFFFNVVPCHEILIANLYEPNIQKQRFIIRTRYIDWLEAQAVYRDSPNIQYVAPGKRTVFEPTTQMYYDIDDSAVEGQNLVQEVTYFCRLLDLELVFLNGILVTKPNAPLSRSDKLYPFAKGGYELVNNGQFFYYKSCAAKIGPDQELVDALYNVIMDGAILATQPPMALFGHQGGLASNIVVPGLVTAFENPNTKMENIGPRVDIRAGLETIGMVEQSISESSQDNLRAGVASGGAEVPTARQALLLEKNAAVAMGLFGQMVRYMVEDAGRLIVSDIVANMTIGQVDALTNELKYRSFVLPAKPTSGRMVSKEVRFDKGMLTRQRMTKDEYLNESYKVLMEEGDLKSNRKISMVNPQAFRELSYRILVKADEMAPRSKALEKALNLEAYDRLIQNPAVDQEKVIKDFLLEVYKPGRGEEYLKRADPMDQTLAQAKEAIGENAAESAASAAGTRRQKGVNSNMVGQMTGGLSLGLAASSE